MGLNKTGMLFCSGMCCKIDSSCLPDFARLLLMNCCVLFNHLIFSVSWYFSLSRNDAAHQVSYDGGYAN